MRESKLAFTQNLACSCLIASLLSESSSIKAFKSIIIPLPWRGRISKYLKFGVVNSDNKIEANNEQ